MILTVSRTPPEKPRRAHAADAQMGKLKRLASQSPVAYPARAPTERTIGIRVSNPLTRIHLYIVSLFGFCASISKPFYGIDKRIGQ